MNVSTRMFSIVGLAVMALRPGIGLADDTDIYVNNAPAPGGEPMVMFSLDYRPNLGSTACQGTECNGLIAEGYLPVQASYVFFDVLRAVLKKVMQPLKGVKVGLMINHDNRNNCAGPTKVVSGCSNGGYIARGFKTFYEDDANGAKAAFHNFLANMPVPQGVQSHSYQGKELFFEFYRYLSGQGIYNGHVGFTDFSSPTNTNLNVDHPLISWDTTVEAVGNTQYLSPLLGGTGCVKIFTVNIMFQVSSQEDDSDTAIKAAVASAGMGLTQNNPTFPNVIQWLRDAELADGTKGTAPNLAGTQNVTSYFIVDPTKINVTTTTYATAGGTGVPLPLDQNPDNLVKTIGDIFKQVLSVSTTTVVFSTDFDSTLPAEIDPATATLTGVQLYAGLGPSGNQFAGNFLRSPTGNTVTLTLSGLPTHTAISLGFLFAAIDSLDGTGAVPPEGDYFRVDLDGNQIFRESFANALDTQIQSYVPPAGGELARKVDLGFQGPGSYYRDSAYNMAIEPLFQNIAHSASTAVFTFVIEGVGIQPLEDESWAMDNLSVSLSGVPANAVDDGPITVTEGVAHIIPVGANDACFTDPVTVTVTTLPTKGTIGVISPPGPVAGMTVTYTSNIGVFGADSFVYEMADSTPASDSATVTINIAPELDTDDDGVVDTADNCTLAFNPIQCDSDGDGYGNRCDADLNNNAATNSQDYVLFRQQFGQPSVAPTYNQADLNCNSVVNSQDYVLFRSLLGSPPGPSGLHP